MRRDQHQSLSIPAVNRQKLKDSQKHISYLESILHGINHRIILIDSNYKILCHNKAAILKNKLKESLLGKYCYRYFENRDSACIDCPTKGTFQSKKVVHIERLYRESERGSSNICKISSYPILNSMGKVKQAVVSSRDVTEIHRIEQIKNDLLKMLTHDIRNPVLATTQTLNICLKKISDDRFMFNNRLIDMLSETRDNNELLLNMIDDVLDIYRYDSEKFFLNKSRVDIKRAVNAAIKLVETLTRDKNIKIFVKSMKNLPSSLIIDENRMIRVIINLLENAIMYSPQNGKITISLMKDENKEKASKRRSYYLKIYITDEGIGIPRNKLEKIFEKNYRVERKSSGSKIGLGLGLQFCRQTVEAHGGRIWAESPAYKGKGSRFVFILPIEDNER